jgi:hypothetical protein
MSVKLDPFICGNWDGSGLWLQWSAVPGAEYELQIRFRAKESDAWGSWVATVPPQGPHSTWGVIPTWKEGWHAQARVRVKPFPDVAEEGVSFDWESASEVTFGFCSALFEILSEKYDQHFVAGTMFHAQVDAAACCYQAREEIFVKAGESARVKLFATGASGYFQLDHPNHFDVRPTFGVRVRNVEASVEDIAPTGRDFTIIEAKAPDVVTMTVTPAASF